MPNVTQPSESKTEEQIQKIALLTDSGFAPGFAG